MFLKVISYMPAIIGLVVISLFVYLNNPKVLKNKIFAALNLFIGFWLLSLFVGDTAKQPTLALWSLRFAGLFSALMFLFFYYFSLVFPVNSRINRTKQILLSLPMLLLALTSFSNLQVISVTIQDFGVQPDKVGPLYSVLDVLGILYLLAGIIILLVKYRKSKKREKNQIKFILFGLSAAIIINIFTGVILTLLKVDTDVILFGSFSLFLFSLFVAFAIIKHGFLDVRLIVARTLGYVLTLATIAGLYSAILFGILSQIIDIKQVTIGLQLTYIGAAVFLAFTFQPIKSFFDQLSNKLFYRDAYEPQVLLNELNGSLVSSIDMNKVLKDSAAIIQQHLKTEYVLFRIEKTATTDSKVISVGQVDSKMFTDKQEFYDLIPQIKDNVVAADELYEKDDKLMKDLLKSNISVVAKLSSRSQKSSVVGYLVLGQKQSGNLFNSQDIRIINIMANELVIAIQNALRFEEIENFTITLQEKVNVATRQLRHTNEKLKALDETKDEFISMASHQLRTPLTSVKGYLSMVLEGDAGKIKSDQAKLLNQAFVSSQRMVYLIADLLNVSRLKTGKFVIETIPCNLADVIEGEISQLTETSKGRNLELIYNKPKDFPVLMLDETKIRQVIMNFIDNAIYYTPAGGHIEVKLVDNPDTVEFMVVDDGLGVPKADQHHLFSKFYRANNAKKARPDGTGLGLFMAKKVIVAQGGAIIFRSQEGKGSTFGFSFAKSRLNAAPKTSAVTKKDSAPTAATR